MTYGKGSNHLRHKENNIYEDEVVQIIKENINYELRNIYFNIQNDEIIIRNIPNINPKRQKEIIQLIKYEIGDHMPLDLQNYVIKYKKIINDKGNRSIQGILFPKKYVDICKSISEKLKIKKKYLYINFDILQKLIDMKIIGSSQDDQITIIENRNKDMVLNTVCNKKIIESYVIDKANSQHSINQFSYDDTYYYGISDDFIKDLQIKKLDIKNKLILNNSEEIVDMTVDNLLAWGMIV